MGLQESYRRKREIPEPDGTATGLVKFIRGWRERIKKTPASAVTQQLSDLDQYEVLVQKLQPLLTLSGHEGYRQWRDDVIGRLDLDRAAWPDRFLRSVHDGQSAEQLLLAAAIFASTQVMGRRMFAVVDAAEDEKARYDRYREKIKEGTE